MPTAEIYACPLNRRRTARELYVKLFVVSFTVIGALLRLLKLRGERYNIPRVILFTVTPLASIVQTVLPLAVIAVTSLIYAIVYGPSRAIEKADSLLAVAAGPLKGEEEEYQRLPPADSEQVAHSSKKRSLWDLGKPLTLAAFTTQCITSLVIYQRRVARHANALIDDWIFGLALAGLGIAIQTFIILLRPPSKPTEPHYSLAPLAKEMSEFGASRVFSLKTHLWTIRLGFGVLGESAEAAMRNYTLLWDNLSALAAFAIIIRHLIPLLFTEPEDMPPEISSLLRNAIGIISLAIVSQWCILLLVSISWLRALMDLIQNLIASGYWPLNGRNIAVSRIRQIWRRCLTYWNRQTGPLAVLIMIVVFVVTFAVSFAGGSLVVSVLAMGIVCYVFSPALCLASYIIYFVALFQEVASISSWPIDKPCPILWVDKLADALWWLA